MELKAKRSALNELAALSDEELAAEAIDELRLLFCNSEIRDRFCRNVRIIAAARRLTFKRLAHLAGVRPSCISRIFSDRVVNPDLFTVLKIARGLEINMVMLLEADLTYELEKLLKGVGGEKANPVRG